jgi:hypothetical protein
MPHNALSLRFDFVISLEIQTVTSLDTSPLAPSSVPSHSGVCSERRGVQGEDTERKSTRAAVRLGVALVVVAALGALPAPQISGHGDEGGVSSLSLGFLASPFVTLAEARRKKKAPLTPEQERAAQEKERRIQERIKKNREKAAREKKEKEKKGEVKFEDLPREKQRFSPPSPSGAWQLLEQETLLGDDDLSWRWSKRSFEACEHAMKEAKLMKDDPNDMKGSAVPTKGSWVKKGYCHEFQDIVEDVFDIEGHNMADVVGYWDLNTVLEHGEQQAFKMVGYQMVLDVLKWMIENKVKRWDDIRQAYQSKWIGWMLKIVTGDTQNLYNLPPGFDPIDARKAKQREEWDPNYDAEAEKKLREEKMMKGEHGF